MFELINKSGGLKASIITTDTPLTTAKGLLDLIFTDLYTKSKTNEITAVMILYYAASICDAGDTNITKALVATAITQFDAFLKSGAATSVQTALNTNNYAIASQIVQYYAGAANADKTARDLDMTDLTNVFYLATQLCLNSTQ